MHLLFLPIPVAFQLDRHQGRDDGCGLDAGSGVEEQGTGPPGEDILDGSGQFESHGPDHLDLAVGESGMDWFVPLGTIGDELFQLGGVRAMHGEGAFDGLGRPAVDRQRLGPGRSSREPADVDGAVDGVLAHSTVGGPLASGDRDESGVGDEDGVLPGERSGPARSPLPQQRSEAGEGAQDVLNLWFAREVTRGVLEQIGHLGSVGSGLSAGVVDRLIGGAQKDTAQPGDGEENPTIVGLGDHHGGLAGQERAVEDDVRATARAHRSGRARLVEFANGVRLDARGVDDHPGPDRRDGAGLELPMSSTVMRPSSFWLMRYPWLGLVAGRATEAGLMCGLSKGCM